MSVSYGGKVSLGINEIDALREALTELSRKGRAASAATRVLELAKHNHPSLFKDYASSTLMKLTRQLLATEREQPVAASTEERGDDAAPLASGLQPTGVSTAQSAGTIQFDDVALCRAALYHCGYHFLEVSGGDRWIIGERFMLGYTTMDAPANYVLEHAWEVKGRFYRPQEYGYMKYRALIAVEVLKLWGKASAAQRLEGWINQKSGNDEESSTTMSKADTFEINMTFKSKEELNAHKRECKAIEEMNKNTMPEFDPAILVTMGGRTQYARAGFIKLRGVLPWQYRLHEAAKYLAAKSEEDNIKYTDELSIDTILRYWGYPDMPHWGMEITVEQVYGLSFSEFFYEDVKDNPDNKYEPYATSDSADALYEIINYSDCSPTANALMFANLIPGAPPATPLRPGLGASIKSDMVFFEPRNIQPYETIKTFHTQLQIFLMRLDRDGVSWQDAMMLCELRQYKIQKHIRWETVASCLSALQGNGEMVDNLKLNGSLINSTVEYLCKLMTAKGVDILRGRLKSGPLSKEYCEARAAYDQAVPEGDLCVALTKFADATGLPWDEALVEFALRHCRRRGEAAQEEGHKYRLRGVVDMNAIIKHGASLVARGW
jgi:hypothetical protein